MKVLHIVRHAEATQCEPQQTDFDRALTEKGIKTARSVARRLRKAGLTADLMVSSPATRALQTARVFAKALKFSAKHIEPLQMIYDAASNDSLMTVVRRIPGIASDAFLFGHDPSFSAFVRYLIEEFDQGMPKSAVITIGFEIETWEDAAPENARLLRFDYPMGKRERKRQIEAEVQALAASLSTAMSRHLQGVDPRTADQLRRAVFKHHSTKKMHKIATRFVDLNPRFAPKKQ